MTSMDYQDLIPNNVNLRDNRKLLKALSRWHPKFMEWWMDRGPVAYQENDIYLRTAVSVDTSGWAVYDYVRMPEYRWGIFLSPVKGERQIHFGDQIGTDCWDDVPGEHRNELRRLIVTQGDTEPGSVEQQRALSLCAPVALRHAQPLPGERRRGASPVGDGLSAADVLRPRWPRRGRGHADRAARATPIRRASSARSTTPSTTGSTSSASPPTPTATASTSSARWPRARSPRFRSRRASCSPKRRTTCLWARPASRVSLRRSAQLMKENESEDVRPAGGIPLDIVQKYMNYWYSVSLDLFGSEDSTNAANYFSPRPQGSLQRGQPQALPGPDGERRRLRVRALRRRTGQARDQRERSRCVVP